MEKEIKTDKYQGMAKKRPAFLELLKEQYNLRRKNIILLTGDVNDLFFNAEKQDYLFLEQSLYNELKEKFHVIRMDMSTGLSFFSEQDRDSIGQIYETVPEDKKVLEVMIESNRYTPLANLVLLKGITEVFNNKRKQHEKIKPICLILQYAASLFPGGNFNQITELDRQRLVFFLNWINEPLFRESPDLIILVNSIKTEVNEKITELPTVANIEIPLPEERERFQFVRDFAKEHKGIRFSGGKEQFCSTAAGLTLNNINDILESAHRTQEPVTQDLVVAEINTILQARLGSIIRIKYPTHTPDDIIGYKQTTNILKNVFKRCDDPEIAVSAILVSGPNGGGKTFQLEAFATHSGRVVIELVGIRGSYFGETDKFFELLRFHITTFGKILILVDEAHTAFGSVHSEDTHKTEKRLAGNIIKIMGDPSFLGKVLWAMMTSRPDELDPDIKSRSPVQIPIFDPEGEERKDFVNEMFRRKDIRLNESELNVLLEKTDYYSARDFRNLLAEITAERRIRENVGILEVLDNWQASRSIKIQREFQSLIAALHCSYPSLLPAKYREMSEVLITKKIEELKWIMRG